MDLDDKLLKLGLCKGVISLIYPETKLILDKLWESKPHEMYDDAYLYKQDEAHKSFFARWLEWSKPVLDLDPALERFFYPTAGSSEAIRDSIARLAAKSLKDQKLYSIHVFEGEYEGYSSYARAFNLPVVKHSREEYKTSLAQAKIEKGDLFYLSQPSAIDGNVWSGFEQFVIFLGERYPQLKLMLDVCYVGAVAKDYYINLNFPNIQEVFFSLSKVFGIYYHRVGGILSREEIPSLHGNMWFKNIFELRFGEELMKFYSVQELPKRYEKIQTEIVELLKSKFPNIEASDVVLLANKKSTTKNTIMESHLKRANTIRICLTPGMDKRLNHEKLD